MFELVKQLARHICLLIALAGPVLGEDRPSWAVTEAADRLIAKNALFRPGRDGFVKQYDGTLVQYELPTKNYVKQDRGWQVELMSRRWRKRESNGWTAWTDARPQYSAWKIGIIRVDVPASGVQATWAENVNFAGATAPGEAEVMQKLDTQGQRSSTYQPAEQTAPTPSVTDGSYYSQTVPQRPPGPGGLPAGMSRQTTSTVTRSSSVTVPSQNSNRPFINITSVPSATVQSPPTSSAPVLPKTFPSTPPTGNSAIADALTKPFKQVMPFLIGVIVVASIIPQVLKKSKRSPARRPQSRRGSPQGPPPLPQTRPPALSGQPSSGRSSTIENPLHLIQRSDNLLTPAELAFFAVLEPLIHSSYRISAKVRLADLFNAVSGPGQQTAFNKIVGKHIDFVVTDSATSRILCGIELDDSSHQRPDRIQRDQFVNEVFERNHLPLLRIPFSYTYYAAGLRAELTKAELSLPEEA